MEDRLTTPAPIDPALTHVRADGSAHMVDVSDKAVSRRTAVAEATFLTRPEVIAQIGTASLPKGEALAVARVAGILAAKQTHVLVPLCHPLPITQVAVDFDLRDDRVIITATVSTTARTGVEMEALTAVSVAGLTLYDMVKAVDRSAQLTSIRVMEKVGGTDDWTSTDD